MAEFKGYAKTNKVGSKVGFEFEIDDEDLAGMDEEEIDKIAFEAMCDSGVFEFGYERKDE